jgi:hypothetical protein
MIIFPERCFRVAHELISIQVGDECGVQPIPTDKSTQRRDLLGQYSEQLPQSVGSKFDLGHARPLAGKSEKLNVHNLYRQPLPIADTQEASCSHRNDSMSSRTSSQLPRVEPPAGDESTK